MLSSDLLAMLCCPETRQPLSPLDENRVGRINEVIASGKALNRAGQPVTEKIEGGLLTQDGAWLYPIREKIPILLSEEALPTAQFD